MKSKRIKESFMDNIKTQVGNEILQTLLNDGWKLTSQYDENAFDKGIDYDSFNLERAGIKVMLEWDNWDEWSIVCRNPLIQERIKGMVAHIENRIAVEDNTKRRTTFTVGPTGDAEAANRDEQAN